MRPNLAELDVVIVCTDDVPAHVAEDLVADTSLAKLAILREVRPAGPMAGIGWWLPAAIAVFITDKYVGTLLSETAKEHYPILKAALLRLARKAVGAHRVLHVRELTSSISPLKALSEPHI